jgi:hypothetical protein
MTVINNMSTVFAKKPGDTSARLTVSTDGGSTYTNFTDASTVSNAACRSFDGTNDYLYKSVSDFRSGDSVGTICAWFNNYGGDDSVRSIIFSSSDEAAANHKVALHVDNDNLCVEITQKTSATADRVKTPNGSIANGQWHHAVVTSSGSAYTIYIDGISMELTADSGSNSGDWFADTPNRDNVTIGVIYDDIPQGYWNGLIDDVRVYSVALTASEVWDLYSKGTDDQSANLVGHWKLDDSGATETDETGSNDLTVNGATRITHWSALSPYGEALSDQGGHNVLKFDGTNDDVDCQSGSAIDNIFSGGGTVTAWIKAFGYGESNAGRIASKSSSGSNESGWNWYLHSSDEMGFIRGFSGTNGTWYTTEDSFSLASGEGENEYGKWIFVAVTYNEDSTGNDPVMYINGDSITVNKTATPTSSAGSDAGQNLHIGSRQTDRYFDGLIGSLTLYSDIRTASEIATEFLNGYPDFADANFAASWHLNEGTGTVTRSYQQTLGKDGTISGATWVKDVYRPAIDTVGILDAASDFSSVSQFQYQLFTYSLWPDRAVAIDKLSFHHQKVA